MSSSSRTRHGNDSCFLSADRASPPSHVSGGHFALRFADESAGIRTAYTAISRARSPRQQFGVDAAAVVIEWSDLDSALGLRSTGGWQLSVQQDILASCSARLRVSSKTGSAQFEYARCSDRSDAAIPFLGHSAGWQICQNELELERQLFTFLTDAAKLPRVSILSPRRLDKLRPASFRLNPASELKAGFPYSIDTPRCSRD